MNPDAGVTPAMPATIPLIVATNDGLRCVSHENKENKTPQTLAAIWVLSIALNAMLLASKAIHYMDLNLMQSEKRKEKKKSNETAKFKIQKSYNWKFKMQNLKCKMQNEKLFKIVQFKIQNEYSNEKIFFKKKETNK